MAEKSKGATLADVAALCGISRSSVSTILSSKYGENYALATREKVRVAAERLGYIPHSRARNLRLNRSHLVGLYVAGHLRSFGGFGNPGPVAVFNGAREILRASEYQPLVVEASDDGEPAAELLRAAKAKTVDAALVLMDGHMAATDLRRLEGLGLRVLVLEATHSNSSGIIRIDEEGAMRQVLSHLLALGHRRVCYLGHPGAFPARWKAFATLSRRMEFRGRAVAVRSYGPDLYARTALELVDRRRGAPTALVIGRGDFGAVAALRALNDAGYRVPQDVSLVGWKDTPVEAFVGLTTVRKPFGEIGRRGAEELLKMLADARYRPKRAVLPAPLVVRHTTGPATG